MYANLKAIARDTDASAILADSRRYRERRRRRRALAPTIPDRTKRTHETRIATTRTKLTEKLTKKKRNEACPTKLL